MLWISTRIPAEVKLLSTLRLLDDHALIRELIRHAYNVVNPDLFFNDPSQHKEWEAGDSVLAQILALNLDVYELLYAFEPYHKDLPVALLANHCVSRLKTLRLRCDPMKRTRINGYLRTFT
jgi:hypothetical protein